MLTLFLFARPIFKDYLVRPNDMMYSFGGDALVLYYNTSYHARYGDGPMLHGMNYPDGEYIYLTDAQGSLSNTLQWVNRHITDICHSAVGFVNGLNLYLLFPAALILFFLLRALGCSWAASVLFSPLVLLLSPQIIRMGGHFGLAYPFLIPLAMLWFLRKYRLGQLEKRDALVFATSLFFTFNNPYTGFNFNLFLVFAGFLTLLAHRFQRNWWKTAGIVSGMGISVLAVAFLDFKINDPVSDRVNPQWGFFDYHANLQGLFNPPGSILHGWLTRWGVKVTEMDFETLLNIGLVSTLALACILFLSLWSSFSRTQKTQLQRLSTEHRVLIGAAALMFIIAANTTVLPLSKEWIEQHLSWLLMFKASGRLAWPMYFALALTGVVWADRISKKMPFKWLGFVFLLAAASLWNAEINQYMRPRFREVFHPNFFDKAHEEEILAVLRDNRIEPDSFQAILVLPKMMSWSDKMISDINFRAQFSSHRLSLATGLPMVNAMLSRIGSRHVLERTQLLSNPLVERSMLPKFPNGKDLLLLVASDADQLKPGERYLRDISQLLATSKDFSLYRLRLHDLARSRAIEAAQAAWLNGDRTPPALHLRFESEAREPYFASKGSHQTVPTEETLAKFVSPYERDTLMQFAAWTYIDPGPWSAGWWVLTVRDANGGEVSRTVLETRKTTDVQDSWLRSEAEIWLPKSCVLDIVSYLPQPMLVDDVMLWPKGISPIVDCPGEDFFLYEGFKVKIPR